MFNRRVGLGTALLVLISLLGCTPEVLHDLLGKCDVAETAGPPDIEGYWISMEVISSYSEDEAEAQPITDVDYWKFVKLEENPAFAYYQVSPACSPDTVTGYATVYQEGTVLIDIIASGHVQLEAMLSENDTMVATHLVSDAAWSARRIEEPLCKEVDGRMVVAMRPLKLFDEERVEMPAANMSAGAEAPNGKAHLAAAKDSRLTMGDETTVRSPDQKTSCTDPSGSAVACPASNVGHAGYIQCVDQEVSESKVQQLADVACLIDTDQIYPGALLQGAHYDGGSFTPITIPRAGGKITLSGLYLGGAANYSATVDEVSYASISNAIAKILNDNGIVGTAANASYRVDSVYSSNQWAFNLGTDVSFMAADLSAAADSGNQSAKNTVIMKFTQVFYTVSFEDPKLATSVFADGEAFDDPENQIGAGNPPLYVSNVKYGRQVYFVATSSLGSSYVNAALRGAYSGAASVTVTSGMSYKDIMAKTSISYIVRGGDAGLALAPIAAATPDEMYDKIKAFLADRNAAVFSAQNPGIPVAYTLRYLDDRTVAMKGLSTTYDQHDCSTIPAADYHFELQASDIDDDLHIWLDYETDAMKKAYTNQSTFYANINNWLPDNNDHLIILKVGNGGCFGTSSRLRFFRDGARIYEDCYYPGGWQDCGWQVDLRVRVNRTNGKFEVVNRWHAH